MVRCEVLPSNAFMLLAMQKNGNEYRLICKTVRHIGGAMRGADAEQISVLVRTMAESKVSKNSLRLFYALGYKLDHELLRVGFFFQFQRGTQITVTVSSVNKMLKLHATNDAVPVTPGIQLVEVTSSASSENYTEVVAVVSSFCEYLTPLLLFLLGALAKLGATVVTYPLLIVKVSRISFNRQIKNFESMLAKIKINFGAQDVNQALAKSIFFVGMGGNVVQNV